MVDGIVETLITRRVALRLSKLELAALTKHYDEHGKGVHYQSIRRLESGECQPRAWTIRVIEDTLEGEAQRREQLRATKDR